MIPAKRKHNPKQPMKAVNWTVILPIAVKDTIFEKADDSHVKLDEETLVNLF
jgi:hypothetical protein